jgi:ribosomal peptide maturation radical SAM protein 1
MFRIALVNMPFSDIELPSLALTQLQSLVEEELPGEARAEVFYASHDFCRHLGLDLYRLICNEVSTSALGDWIFRSEAFPSEPDNFEPYRQRYFPVADERYRALERARSLDIGKLLDQLIDKYRLLDADLVGFTSMFNQSVGSFALARRIKARKPGIVTVIGGANCETPMGEELASSVDAVDYVFSGPALYSFPALLRALIAGDRYRAERIDGVFTRSNVRPGGPAQVAPLGAERDVNDQVPLDYGPFLDTLERDFQGRISPMLLFETSRGCWWGERAHCTFCGLNGTTMKFRYMAPELAIGHLEAMFAHYPRARQFNCVDNIMPKEYPRQVFSRLHAPEGASIFYEVKADLSDEDMALLSAAGVDSLQPGIEALNSTSLTLMRKGMTAARNLVFLKRCLVHDLYPAWNLLIGFPGETEDIYKGYAEVMPKLVHLPPPTGVHPVRFDRFSPYFTQAAQHGLDLAPFDFYSLIYPFPAASLERLAYFFVDQNVLAPYFQSKAKWLARLARVHAQWQQAWKTGRQPVLAFEREGSTRVVDSRSGQTVVHEVGESGREILAALDHPSSMAELAAALERLRALDLLFDDRQRMVSLVLPRPLPTERLLHRFTRKQEALAA